MKTQIITLESHDDLISVRDRMSWAKSRRILLVWPGFVRVALRPVDLRILQEHARHLGADLGLVTRRGGVRRDAGGFGIPVFASSAEAQRKAWPTHRPPAVRPDSEAGSRASRLRAMRDETRIKPSQWTTGVVMRVGSFGLGVTAVLAIVALFVPRATITLSPASMEQDVSLPARAERAAESVAITGSLPAREIKVSVTGTQSARVVSQASVPQDKATGRVQFRNLTQSELVIPAGTVVFSVTPVPERFATLAEARLPGSVNAILEAPIAALEPGAAGNLPANSIESVEGSIGAYAAVTNPEPTTGGSDRLTAVPSPDDRARVREVLLASLEDQAADRIRGSIGKQDVFLPSTLKIGQILEETYDPAAGAPGSLIKITMSLDYTAQYVAADDLRALAEAALDASKPAGFRPLMHSLHLELDSVPLTNASGDSQFSLKARRTLVREIDTRQATSMVRGLTPLAAASVLRTRLPVESAPEISMSPAWWPWLPLIPFRITLSVP